MHQSRSKPRVNPATLTDLSLIDRPAAPCFLAPRGLPGSVSINGNAYQLEYHAIWQQDEGPAVIVGYRLTSRTGATYDLEVTPDGFIRCDCPDYLFRRQEVNGACKHGLALRKLLEDGVLAPPG